MRQFVARKKIVSLVAGVLPLILFAGVAVASGQPATVHAAAVVTSASSPAMAGHNGWNPLDNSFQASLRRAKQAQAARAAQAAVVALQKADALAAAQRQEVAKQAAARASRAAPRPPQTTTPVVPRAPVEPGTNRATGQQMAAGYGWTGDQWDCLDALWGKYESGWNQYDTNRSSGAYGIPQALPGNKMASAGADWQTNPATQIAWGLGYIAGPRYGTPCAALAHRLHFGWY
ncbi:MAG TPA: lytic transglycosylase domain-containing protein [Candidatus Nanoarchaeia archaeon]|nr:lytic transglycosylase domain-containing protein [Candidatus Nanoarchaeia archaeon]